MSRRFSLIALANKNIALPVIHSFALVALSTSSSYHRYTVVPYLAKTGVRTGKRSLLRLGPFDRGIEE